ncbi:MAG: paraquat-inducible protein A [Pseudomonadota bacterium]
MRRASPEGGCAERGRRAPARRAAPAGRPPAFPAGARDRALLAANLALLVLWPVAWTVPVARAGLLPFLEGEPVSVLSALAALWPTDPWLAGLVAGLAVALPWAKTAALVAWHIGRLPRRGLPALAWLGRLSMAEVFLVALLVALMRGPVLGHVEPARGLALFAACALASLALSILAERRSAP